MGRFSIMGMLAVVLLLAPPEGAAQGRQAFLQAGVGALPGAGLQIGYSGPRSIYTIEAMLYADGQPSFFGNRESTLRLSGGLGAALRPLGVLRVIGNADYPFDFDLGARFGPSLLFTSRATRADKNQQFGLFLDPFLRFTSRFRSGRIFFLEVGPQQPTFRAGLWFGFG